MATLVDIYDISFVNKEGKSLSMFVTPHGNAHNAFEYGTLNVNITFVLHRIFKITLSIGELPEEGESSLQWLH